MELHPTATGVTCIMASHNVTRHLTQVNTPCLNPSSIGQYLIYLPQRDGRAELTSYGWANNKVSKLCMFYAQLVFLLWLM